MRAARVVPRVAPGASIFRRATLSTASTPRAGHAAPADALRGKPGSAFVVTAPWERHTKSTHGDYMLSHAVYTPTEVESVQKTHYEPLTVTDRAALKALRLVRRTFDAVTGYEPGQMTAGRYLSRMIFLETVAGVPGMVAAMVRHLKSLRSLHRDHGWIGTLLGEAENERMHLLTFIAMRDRKPGVLFRAAVMATQGVMCNAYFVLYTLAPSTCHRFVGYLEEEAVSTYTNAIKELDDGKLPEWERAPVPELARKYWRLPATATVRDLLLAIRADEAIHRDVNHVLGDLKPDEQSPFL